MSISPVASSASASASASASVSAIDDSTAKAQLVRDQKQLAADIKASASQQQIQADMMAVASDEVTIAEAASSTVAATL